ncbi:hypothetical protein PIB30_055884 [Stylosanthes scabra]|uniref:Uncharacterized protein n=1 Tax=Stylosanthes scabra TaxID=79078 RepID=A0ABU6XH61_9FABA|nr:hypothetical protein [Stylosanthes scabra]
MAQIISIIGTLQIHFLDAMINYELDGVRGINYERVYGGEDNAETVGGRMSGLVQSKHNYSIRFEIFGFDPMYYEAQLNTSKSKKSYKVDGSMVSGSKQSRNESDDTRLDSSCACPFPPKFGPCMDRIHVRLDLDMVSNSSQVVRETHLGGVGEGASATPLEKDRPTTRTGLIEDVPHKVADEPAVGSVGFANPELAKIEDELKFMEIEGGGVGNGDHEDEELSV